LSYLADLSLAEDDHDWQALLLWRRRARGTARCAFARPHQQVAMIDLVFMWSDRRRARRSPVRVADLIAAFGARRTGLRLAAAAISVTAAGRDGSRGQRRCQDQEHSAPRARVPGRSRPVAAPSAGSLAGDNHAGRLSLRRVTVKVQGRVVAAPAPVGGHQPAGRLAGAPAARVWPPGESSPPARNRLCRRP